MNGGMDWKRPLIYIKTLHPNTKKKLLISSICMGYQIQRIANPKHTQERISIM